MYVVMRELILCMTIEVCIHDYIHKLHIIMYYTFSDVPFYLPLAQIQKVETEDQWATQITATDEDALGSCGIPFARVDNQAAVVEAVVKHSCIFGVKAELDQLREGMEMFHLHLSRVHKASTGIPAPLYAFGETNHSCKFARSLPHDLFASWDKCQR